MKKSNKFSPEVRKLAVRLVQEHRGEYPSLWAAIESIVTKIGWLGQGSRQRADLTPYSCCSPLKQAHYLSIVGGSALGLKRQQGG